MPIGKHLDGEFHQGREERRALSRVYVLPVVWLMTWNCVGCAPRQGRNPAWIQTNLEAGHEAIRRNAQRRFPRAVLFKPREEPSLGLLSDMAPLIVVEVRNAQDRGAIAPFGEVYRDATGDFDVDITKHTVYTEALTGGSDDRPFDVVRYAWFQPAISPAATMEELPVTVLEMVLDGDGYPMIWEAVGPMLVAQTALPQPRRLYASKDLERQTCQTYRATLPGRRYCAEPALGVEPDVLTVELVEPGPIPMGPYVYLDAASNEATTVLCRCSPSRVDEFVETSDYDLRWMGELPIAAPSNRADSSEQTMEFESSLRSLESWRLLRIPKSIRP